MWLPVDSAARNSLTTSCKPSTRSRQPSAHAFCILPEVHHDVPDTSQDNGGGHTQTWRCMRQLGLQRVQGNRVPAQWSAMMYSQTSVTGYTLTIADASTLFWSACSSSSIPATSSKRHPASFSVRPETLQRDRSPVA